MRIKDIPIIQVKDFPTHIISECGDKFVKNTGNLRFLASCIYASNHYPVRILVDEGGEGFTCGFVVYISSKYLVCIDTSSKNENFQSIFKIPVDSLREMCYNECKFKVYVKETLCK